MIGALKRAVFTQPLSPLEGGGTFSFAGTTRKMVFLDLKAVLSCFDGAAIFPNRVSFS